MHRRYFTLVKCSAQIGSYDNFNRQTSVGVRGVVGSCDGVTRVYLEHAIHDFSICRITAHSPDGDIQVVMVVPYTIGVLVRDSCGNIVTKPSFVIEVGVVVTHYDHLHEYAPGIREDMSLSACRPDPPALTVEVDDPTGDDVAADAPVGADRVYHRRARVAPSAF